MREPQVNMKSLRGSRKEIVQKGKKRKKYVEK